MQKQKIAIISVLKPVDDIRSFEKIAKSISSIENVEVHLFGQASQLQPATSESIVFHAHNSHKVPILSRLLSGLKVLIGLFKVRPNIIIANTHELLIVTVLYRILFGSKILYDIQENYYFNLLYQNNYAWLIRSPVAFLVRLKELLLSPFFNHFVLAERTYIEELPFVKNRFTLLENKTIVPSNWNKKTKSPSFTFLFSGTITESNGIFKALDWFDQIRSVGSDIKLVICGHCPNKKILNQLESLETEQIQIDISSHPLPHQRILEHISNSDAGIVAYRINKSNQFCMPTKVFEYIALGLPILFEEGSHWQGLIENKKAGISFKLIDPKPYLITDQLKTIDTSLQTIPDPDVTWSEEKEIVRTLISELLQ